MEATIPFMIYLGSHTLPLGNISLVIQSTLFTVGLHRICLPGSKDHLEAGCHGVKRYTMSFGLCDVS